MPRSATPTPPLDEPHLQHSTKRRVSYFYDPDVGGFAYPYQHPMKPHRMRMAHALIGAYGMLGHMQVVRPKRADELALTRFHTDEYIQFLKSITAENYMEWTSNKKFCQTDDCPPWDGLFDFATLTAGSSISAAHSLVTGHSDIAIAWAGGLHHAKRAEASGFCYVNDIVLGILELLRVHARVLYVDIDIHHGDGVEEAFYTTDRVMTCSFHKFGDFFPGTGTVGDVGKGRGKGYAVNVPLRDGLSDERFVQTFKSVIGRVMEWYRPGAVVLQGGADSLAGDKLGVFNLSMNGHAACASYMRTFNVPLLMVGGGGYTVKNVSRTWTYETAVAIGCAGDISPDLPDNEYLEWFGPRYKLEVLRNNMEDYNSSEYLEGIKERIWENMRDLPHAPSAGVSGIQEGRQTWKGDDWEEDDSDMDDLDKRISQRLRDAHTKAAEDPLTDSEDSGYDSDDGPGAAGRTFRARRLPRKHKYSERFTPSPPSFSDSDEGEDEEDAAPKYAPRKRPRTFFAGTPGAFVDPRLAEWQKEERERERVEALRSAEREKEREQLRKALAEVMEEELALGREERHPLVGARGEEDVDMDEEDERDKKDQEDQEGDDAEDAEEGDEDEDEEHDRFKPMLHPAVLERLGSQEKEDQEDRDDQEEQEDEEGEEAEDAEGDEREEDEDEKDAHMDVDDEDADVEEGEEGEAVVEEPPAEDDAEQDGSELSEEEEGGTVEAEHDAEGDQEAEQDDEAEVDVGDDEGTGTVEDAEDHEHDATLEQERDAEERDADDADGDAGNGEAGESRLPTPTGASPDPQLPTPESSEPSTVSLSRSPSGSPPATGAQSREELEEGEEEEERGRNTGTKDLRLEDLADVAGARERPTKSPPIVGRPSVASP